MKDKFNLVKTVIMIVASALTLVAVTFSWFSRSTQSSTNAWNVQASKGSFSAKFYEAVDKNYNGILDIDEIYEPMNNAGFKLENMLPGYTNFYKTEIYAKDDGLKVTISLDGIPEKKNVPAPLRDCLQIYFCLYDYNGTTPLISSDSAETQQDGYILLENLYDTAGKKVTLVDAYDLSGHISSALGENPAVTNPKFDFYYRIGIRGEDNTNILEGYTQNSHSAVQGIGLDENGNFVGYSLGNLKIVVKAS